jgi:glycosyltransferase involved in cell wall biosynthesis
LNTYNPLNIILLYTGSTGFPLGDAYTNRVLSIAKGLVEVQCNVKILIIYPGRKSGVHGKKGTYNRIPYEYLTPQQTSKIYIIKKLIGLWGIFATIYYILFKIRKADAIISFTESKIYNLLIGITAGFKNVLFYREINEFPRNLIKKDTKELTSYQKFLLKKVLSRIDGLICISDGLREFFINTLSYKKPILVVPITVDIERFNPVNVPATQVCKCITFCGNLFGEKDGVEILIRAFAKIASRHTEYIIRLIGDKSNTGELKKLNELIHKEGLSDKVSFTGYIGRDEIPYFLSESAVLVLARPNNIQAQGGFPTKLGEYLATGKPVLVTSVGDIPKYLTDGLNSFIAKPGNIDNFSEKLDYVLSNYELAIEVGKKGRLLAEEQFEGRKQAIRITDFILKLRQNKL